MKRVFTLLLAGGEGTRLLPLTQYRAKPAVPFGGIYRLIDFTLSNCVNSGMRRVGVLLQTKSTSLNRHLQLAWNVFRPELNEYIVPIYPAFSGRGDIFKGTADAVFQNLRLIHDDASEVLIVSGDHIYKMDYSKLVAHHRAHRAGATVAVIEVERSKARELGVVEQDAAGRIVGFHEKPSAPAPAPRNAACSLVSMGVYVFDRELLLGTLTTEAIAAGDLDFGKNVLPKLMKSHRVMGYDFVDENKKLSVYWRDVGTIDAYWEANMDLVGVDPVFNLYDRSWPLRTYQPPNPPAKFVFANDVPGGRCGKALDSIVAPGAIVSGGRVSRCVLSPNVYVDSWSDVTESVLMADVSIGPHCRIRRTIVDKGVSIPPHTVIGVNADEDRRRFLVSPAGIVVIPKYATMAAPGGVVCLGGVVPEREKL